MSTGKRETVDNDDEDSSSSSVNYNSNRGEAKHPIDVKNSTYKTLTQKAKERGLSIRQYVNDLLYLVMQKQDFIKKYCPDIYLDSLGRNSLYLKDYRPVLDDSSIGSPKTAEISIIDNKVYCSLDKSNDCVHIHFAYCLPEIAVLLRERDNEYEEQQEQIEEEERGGEETEEEANSNRNKKKLMPSVARTSLISVALSGAALTSMMYLTTVASINLVHHASHVLTHLAG